MKIMQKPKEGMVEGTSLSGKIMNIVLGLLLLLIAFCCIIPMWHVLMSSISDGKALFKTDGLVLWPAGEFNLKGYALIFKDSSIIRSYIVTIFYVAASCLVGLVVNVLAGYVLSRSSKLKPVLMALTLVSIMFNGGLIPTYMVIRDLGWVGSPLAVIIPGCTNAMMMVMMMNAFLQVPKDTVEAAKIDGAGHLQVMFKVMLPQARGLALVTVINTGLGVWNSWFEASIYLPSNKEWWPLQLLIKDLVSRNQDFLNYANPDYNRYLIQYCVIVAATLPALIAVAFFIKKLEKNMVLGAVKG